MAAETMAAVRPSTKAAMTIGKTARKTRLRPGVSTNARSTKMPRSRPKIACTEPLPACPCSTHGAHHTCPASARHGCRRRSAPGAATAARPGPARSAPAPTRAAPRRGAPARRRSPSSACGEGLGVGGHGHGLRPRAQARQVGRDRAPAQAGVLEDPVGQGGVVEGLDLERHDARRRRTGPGARPPRPPAPEPHEVRAPRGRRRSPASSPHSSSCHVADEQQHEPVAEALADRAQQRPVGAPAEVAERDGDDVAALRRREGVGGERHA